MNSLEKVLCAGLATSCLGLVVPGDAIAKKYTIYQRQVILRDRINRAEKAKELTFKEAKDLREDLGDIQNRKINMMNNNNGKLAYDDETDLEQDLNKVSATIHKWKLNKRVASK